MRSEQLKDDGTWPCVIHGGTVGAYGYRIIDGKFETKKAELNFET
jgi:hypothetical protein